MKRRDESLDRLRAFVILWTILVHVLYWGEFCSSEGFIFWRSYCLLEMPLIFFVTGAGNAMSREKSYKGFVRKRWCSMLIPYWVFAAICIVLSLMAYPEYQTQDTAFVWKVVFSWLIPMDQQMTNLPYLTWALWFVPVYLCVVPAIPLLRKMSQRRGKFLYLPLLLVLFLGAVWVKHAFLQKVTFYTLWTYVGMFYPQISKAIRRGRTKLLLAAAVLAGIAGMYALYRLGKPMDMQNNKFPPNRIFLLYSCTMMSAVGLVWPLLDNALERLQCYEPFRTVLHQYSNRSMTIFLYQVIVFPLMIYACNILFPGGSAGMAIFKSVLCFVLTVAACTGCAAVFGKLETFANDVSNIKSLKIQIEWRDDQ